MLLDINKITLEMVRGDTFTLPLRLNSGTREKFCQHVLSCDDKIYIGIMKPGQSFEHAEIRYMIDCNSPRDTFGDPVMQLDHEHTVGMKPGKYYMTIKFVSGNTVQTLVDNKLFFITGSDPCC